MKPATQKLFTSVLLAMLLIATVANGALAAGRAASHVGGVAAAAPPCHHIVDTGLAPLALDPCDTLCVGSAPELTQDQPPSPDLVLVMAAMAMPEMENGPQQIAASRPAHRHPPPLPPYQRDRRLLI